MPDNQITPNAETVFTGEYWTGAVPLERYAEDDVRRGVVGWGTSKEVEQVVSFAAASLLAGNPVQPIVEGSSLADSEGLYYTQSGSSILTDLEYLVPLTDKTERLVAKAKQNAADVSPKERPFIEDPMEIETGAVILFRNNMIPPNQHRARPLVVEYAKSLVNEATGSMYLRVISIAVFAPNRRGGICAVRVPEYARMDERRGPIMGQALGNPFEYLPPYRVGKNYTSHITRFGDGLIKLRTAEFIERGKLSPVRAKQRRSLPVRLRGLVALPGS